MYTVEELKHGLSWAVLRPSDKTIGGTYCVATSYSKEDAENIARALNLESAMGEVREALAVCQKALHDIVNAAQNGEPYSADELAGFACDAHGTATDALEALAAIHRRDVCFEACATIPNPAGIPGAVEFIKLINTAYEGQPTGSRAREALELMGVEP
jgi:hypothetical protein